jgi:hypothetical protein
MSDDRFPTPVEGTPEQEPHAEEKAAVGGESSAPADAAAVAEASTHPAPAETAPGEGPRTEEPPTVEGQGAPSEGGWVPTWRQVADAARLDMVAALGPEPEWPDFQRGVHSSMRQMTGLITIVTLVAGLPALVTNWIDLAARHTTLQISQLQGVLDRLGQVAPGRLAPGMGDALTTSSQLLSGLTPMGGPQLAAGLSALSAWLALPLRVATVWIAYGVLVLLVAKLLGSGATLPRFYAATGLAVLPIALLVFFPVPLVGPWIGAVALILAFVAYIWAVSAATGLDRWRAAISALLPAAVLALAGVLLGGLTFWWLL